MGNRLLT